MSGLIGQLLSNFTGQSNVAGTVQQIFNENGGISGLVSRFQNAGLGETVRSWVSSGPNQPISGEQIGQVFSGEELQNWAGKIGIPPETVSSLLAQVLPSIVDQSTPNGELPAQEDSPSSSGWTSLVGKLFGR